MSPVLPTLPRLPTRFHASLALALVAVAATALLVAPHAAPHLPNVILGTRQAASLRPREVYATFLESGGPLMDAYPDRSRFETVEEDDHYFNSILMMAHSLRRVEATRDRQQRDFLVLHLSTVHPSKLEELRRMGATPLEVDPIQPHSDIVPYSPRWIMQFTKLWLFGLTQYDKIVYLDADILIVDNLEPLFDLRRDVRGHEWEQSVRWDYERKSPVLQVLADDVANGTSLDSYAFGAAAGAYPQFDQRGSWVAPRTLSAFNAGVFVLKPAKPMFDLLLAFAQRRPDIEWHFGKMEQDLLNYIFGEQREMVHYFLEWRYNVHDARDELLPLGLAVAHERYWRKAAYADPSKQKIAGRWWELLGEVEAQRKKRWSFSLRFSS